MNQILFAGTLNDLLESSEININEPKQINKPIEQENILANDIKEDAKTIMQGYENVISKRSESSAVKTVIENNTINPIIKSDDKNIFKSNVVIINKELEKVRITVQVDELIRIKQEKQKKISDRNKSKQPKDKANGNTKIIYTKTLLQREKNRDYNLKKKK